MSTLSKAEASTLYVHRPLLNGEALQAWAAEQGFTSTLPTDDMHATIAFSKAPFDHSNLEPQANTIIAIGGPRSIEQFGEGAVVLRFYSAALEERWQEFVDAGASWDHESYNPHVTLTYEPGDVDISAVEPFTGTLTFGPEVFGPVKENWHDDIEEEATMIEAKKSSSLAMLFGGLAGMFGGGQVGKAMDPGDVHTPIAIGSEPGAKQPAKKPKKKPKPAAGYKWETASKVCKVDQSLGLVFGWAIVCKVAGEDYVDLQDDHIPEQAMLEAACDFMENSRVAKEMHDKNDPIGSIVFAFPMTTDIAKSLGIETAQTGLLIAMKPSADVLAKFASGEFTGFSIGGEYLETEEMA